MHYNISVDGYSGFRYLNNIETTRSKAIERLSSGYRINHTSDDAAGASMSNYLRTQIRGLMQAARNSEDMVNLLDTAETGIATMTEMLQRIRELSVQAASDTNTAEDRMYMQEEVAQLLKEIDRVSKDTEFNGIALFNNDPDIVGRMGGLAAVLGPDHITPNGNLSESYGTWQILDKDKLDAGVSNATPDVYKTVITQYTEYEPYDSAYAYSGFSANGASYTGKLFDKDGKQIGTMSGNTLTLNGDGKNILPEKVTNPSYTTGKTSTNSTTYTAAGTKKQPLTDTVIDSNRTVGAAASQVFGKDASGNLVALSYSVNEKATRTGTQHISYQDYSTTHIGATINFENYNKSYTNANLYDTGFNSTCATCNRHYSIKFVKGEKNEVVPNGSHYTLNIGIDVLKKDATGEDFAKLVVDALTACKSSPDGGSGMITHFTQYAYKGATLYIFDNRKGRQGNDDTFKAEVYGEPIKAVSRQPLIHAQVGSNTDDRVAIEFPYLSLQTLKLEDVSVTTRESATDALGRMDEAILFLTKERAKISLWGARISHSASNADIGAYNHTLSDSKVMDTNYGEEMLQVSKAQVLTEFGISSVTEVQKMIENVLKFIS